MNKGLIALLVLLLLGLSGFGYWLYVTKYTKLPSVTFEQPIGSEFDPSTFPPGVVEVAETVQNVEGSTTSERSVASLSNLVVVSYGLGNSIKVGGDTVPVGELIVKFRNEHEGKSILIPFFSEVVVKRVPANSDSVDGPGEVVSVDQLDLSGGQRVAIAFMYVSKTGAGFKQGMEIFCENSDGLKIGCTYALERGLGNRSVDFSNWLNGQLSQMNQLTLDYSVAFPLMIEVYE